MTAAADPLRASPSFRGLPEAWLRRLHDAATPIALEAGDVLAADRLYLLVSGEVSLSTPPRRDTTSEIVGRETQGSVIARTDDLVHQAAGPVQAYVWEAADLARLY